MKWKSNKAKTEWESGEYRIVKGQARTPMGLKDIFHCYDGGEYVSQEEGLDDAKEYFVD